MEKEKVGLKPTAVGPELNSAHTHTLLLTVKITGFGRHKDGEKDLIKIEKLKKAV